MSRAIEALDLHRTAHRAGRGFPAPTLRRAVRRSRDVGVTRA
jgi:hypothetical protein